MGQGLSPQPRMLMARAESHEKLCQNKLPWGKKREGVYPPPPNFEPSSSVVGRTNPLGLPDLALRASVQVGLTIFGISAENQVPDLDDVKNGKSAENHQPDPLPS